MKNLRFISLILSGLLYLSMQASDPSATDYTFSQCEGSLTPYPTNIQNIAYPDSLKPVFINHVGRHGARYPASAANTLAMERALLRADSLHTITALGRQLLQLTREIRIASENRWGALDSVGIAEQQGIAARMFRNYAEVFTTSPKVTALSSYSPRAMMSMYAFTHQLDRLNNRIEFSTSTGRSNSALMRPFDVDRDYITFSREKPWQAPYNEYFNATAPGSPARKVLGANYPFEDEAEAQQLSLIEYYVLAGLPAMGMEAALETYMNRAEANALWSCFNLRQYLCRTASTVSTVPADIAADLVLNLIETTDRYIDGTDRSIGAVLRFGHAETLMPLVSLLKLPGCYYVTNYFDTVAAHWQDFNVVPMAANIQFIVFEAKESGHYYVRVDLNEQPVAMRRGDDTIYYPWGELRRYMMNCVPLYAQ